MIRKLLATLAILFAAHFVLVRAVFPDARGEFQSGWQINIMIAEQFMFGTAHFNHVLIGSSLTQRITDDLLPTDDWYNLSLSGMGVNEGFEILRNSRNLPDTIYVESNMILRDPNNDFLDKLLRFPAYPLKKNTGYLLENQKPVPLIAPVLEERVVRKVLGKVEFEVLKRLTGTGPATADIPAPLHDQEAGGTIRQQLIDKYDPVNDSILDVRMSALRDHVTYFSERGIRIVFYEMPLEDFVCSLGSFTALRERISSSFDGSCCDFIDQPDCGEYTTTDGLHLDRENIVRYTGYLFGKIADIPQGTQTYNNQHQHTQSTHGQIH